MIISKQDRLFIDKKIDELGRRATILKQLMMKLNTLEQNFSKIDEWNDEVDEISDDIDQTTYSMIRFVN